MAGIFENLPGYLKVPTATDGNFNGWMKRITPKASKPGPWDSFNYWGNTPKFAVSFQKALYGDAATKQTDCCLRLSAKSGPQLLVGLSLGQHVQRHRQGTFRLWHERRGDWPDTTKNIDALKKADWLVVGEIYPDETSEFWKSPGITTDEMKDIQTTVYRLPCAGFAEKDGTFTNSARWLQWKNAALPMPGDCRLDQAIVAQIFSEGPRTVQEAGREVPRPDLAVDLGIYGSDQSITGRSTEGN
jgi:hypothetical protein